MLSPDDDYEEAPDTLRDDLEYLRQRGNQMRLNYKRELLSLKSELAPLVKSLHTKHEKGVDISTYHESLDQSSCASGDGFEDVDEQLEDHQQVTPFVKKIQAQLCSALHQQEINKTLIQIAQKSNKGVIIYLSNEIDYVKEVQKLTSKECQAKVEEHKTINQILEETLERDALEQEEEIATLRLDRGMDPVPNSQRQSYEQSRPRRRRMQRLSGNLREMRRRVRETPKHINFKDPKVWKDFMRAEKAEQRDSEDGIPRGRFASMNLRRRSQQMNNDINSDLRAMERQGKGFFRRKTFEKSFQESSREVRGNGGSGRMKKWLERRGSGRSLSSTAPSTPQSERILSSFDGVADDFSLDDIILKI